MTKNLRNCLGLLSQYAKDRLIISIMTLCSSTALTSSHAAVFELKEIPLKANEIISHPEKNIIFAAIPSTSKTSYANHLLTINYKTGKIIGDIFAGSEPSGLAISSHGEYVYIKYSGSGSFSRYNTKTKRKELTLFLGSNWKGPNYAEDMAVSPDRPKTVAISLQNSCCSPRHEGVVIYQDDKLLEKKTPGHTGANVIAFPKNSSNYLYGLNNETSEFGFRKIEVSENGLEVVSTTPLPTNFYTTFKIFGDFAYTSLGQKIEYSTGNIHGTFASSGSFVVDQKKHRIFFLHQNEIAVFNTDTFTQVDSIDLKGKRGYNLIKLHDGGLAFQSSESLYIVTLHSVA